MLFAVTQSLFYLSRELMSLLYIYNLQNNPVFNIMKNSLTLILVLFFYSYSSAYDNIDKFNSKKIDSLKKVINKIAPITIDYFYNSVLLGEHYILENQFKESDKVINKLSSLIDLGTEKITLKKGLLLRLETFFYDQNNDIKTAILKGKEALVVLEKTPNSRYSKESIISILNILVKSFEIIGSNDSALVHLFKLDSIYSGQVLSEKTIKKKIHINSFISHIYTSVNEYDLAHEYINKSLKLVNKHNIEESKITLYNVLGGIYLSQKDYKKANEYFKVSKKLGVNSNNKGLLPTLNNLAYTQLKLGEINDAEFNAKIVIKDSSNFNVSAKAASLLILSRVYFIKNELKLSKEFLDRSLAISKEINLIENTIDALLHKSQLIRKMGNEKEALDVLLIAKNKSDILNIDIISCEVLKEFRDFFYKKNNDKYKEYELLHSICQQKISDRNDKMKMEMLKTEFNYLKIKNDLMKSEQNLLMSRISEKYNRNLALAISFISLFIIISGYIVYVSVRKNNKVKVKMLLVQNNLIEQEQINLEQELNHKNKQVTDFALYISQKNELLNFMKSNIKALSKSDKLLSDINKLIYYINNNLEKNKEEVLLYEKIEQNNTRFITKIETSFPDLNEKQKKIIILIRLNNSSKQIAETLGLTLSSVDNYRSKLRSKLNVPSGASLNKFVKKL